MVVRSLAWVLCTLSTTSAAELFNTRVAILEAFPRSVARGRKVILKGTLKGDYTSPHLVIIAPNAKTYLNKRNTVSGKDFVFEVRFEEGVGRYRMEIMARRPDSIRSAARFDLFHGKRASGYEEPPLPNGPRTPMAIDTLLAEKRFFRKLNDFRASVRLRPVAWNEAVSARAREHASRMARARRRIHRFGGVGVVEMLRRNGAGTRGYSGPDRGWERVDMIRPFDRPAPQSPGPLVRNHVVPFVVADSSLTVLFERAFVREPAFRICATDPFCLEVGVGASRPPPPRAATTGNKTTVRFGSPVVYYSICFVQVNDKTLRAGQNEAYADLLEAARSRHPDHLRTVGIWGRPGKGKRLLDGALKDRRPEVAGAAIDGLLLLDEERTRRQLSEFARRARDAREKRLYGRAIALRGPQARVAYDLWIRRHANDFLREVREQARSEFARVRKLAEPDRTRALKDLLRRCAGMKLAEEEIKKALG